MEPLNDPDPTGVKHALARLRRALARDLAEVAELEAVKARRDELAELMADLDQQLERVRGAAVITLVGATGAGKSTLLNALVGARIAQEGETRPTTSAPVIYRPRDADLRGLLTDLPGKEPVVVDYDPGAGGPWREQVLIDAPDVNSVATQHREVVRTLAERSDVLVVVAHHQSVAELASVAFVDAFAGRRGMLFVLNRADELTDDAREELLGQLRSLAAERWQAPDAPVLAVSARQARTQPTAPGWAALCQELETLVRGGVLGRVRRHNAMGTAARIGSTLAQVREETHADLIALDAALETGAAAWRDSLDAEVGERLTLRRPSVRELLWTECARRWDGPGGWALRAGGLGALGLGAGAVLARRSPLLAAGAAAGALAADRARDVVRGQRLADVAGLLPDASTLDQGYREALGPARLLASRLAGEPTALGVPAGDALTAETATVVENVWERLVGRELPRAAERTARWFVRWPVDLPVYALGAFVVGSAGWGFWRGQYVGVDFLVNAAVLALAWLFLGRTAVRSVLGARSRTLVGSARTEASAALERVAAEAESRARSVVAAQRTTLDRLASLEERWRQSF